MKLMRIGEANRYVKERGILLPNKQVLLTEPLKVFKKIRVDRISGSFGNWNNYEEAIANLVIPIGAVVNLADAYDGVKMRASQAYCFSIATINDKKEVDKGYSTYNSDFKYHSGKQLGLKDKDYENLALDHEKYFPTIRTWSAVPSDKKKEAKKQAFLKSKCVPDSFGLTAGVTCTGGIHFFLELKRALDY